MNELELRVMFRVVQDPEKNALNVGLAPIQEEVRRIIRIFNLYQKQQKAQGGMAIKNLPHFELTQSFN